jgi:Tfp pilus assembly protein PilZ
VKRRQDARWSRYIDVKFTRRGDQSSFVGHTTNVSRSGMFLVSPKVFNSGTRLRVEVLDDDHGFVAEAVVARSCRAPIELQRVKPSGMGIRFLGVEELMAGFLPEVDEDEEPELEVAKTEPRVARFRVTYGTPSHFREVLERDVATGGIFIPTNRPAALNQVIEVEVEVNGQPWPSVTVTAQVVQRYLPEDETALAGMGVQFLDFAGARKALTPLAGKA